MTLTFDRAAAWLRKRVWLGLVAGVIVWGAWLGSLALGDGESDFLGQIVSVDHLAFYSPAKMIREGLEADVYDNQKLFEYQRGLFAPGKWESFEKLRNPPFYALWYLPTSYLPYWASAWVWTGIGLACLIVGIRWLGSDRPWRATAWALSFLPVFAVVSYGQNSLISFAMFCGTYRLLATNRPFAAGLVSGLLLFKPQLLLGLFVWWVLDVRRFWKCFLGCAVAGAALAALSYPFVPAAWANFVATLAENLRFDNFDWWKAHNARAFWRQLLSPNAIVSVAGQEVSLPMVLWAVSALAGVALFVRLWVACRDNLEVMFGASVLLMLWATPHAMIYEWSVAVVPAVLWWAHLPRLRPALLVLNAVLWVALFVSTEIGRAQEYIEKKLFNLEETYVFQVSVPVFAWACWQAYRLFAAEVRSKGPFPTPPVPPAADAP